MQTRAPLRTTRQGIAKLRGGPQPPLGYRKISAGGAHFAAPVPANRGYLCKMQQGPRQAAYSMNRTVENGMDGASPGGIGWLTGRQPFVDQLFAASGATSWGLPRGLFAAALERSASKRFGEESPGAGKIEEYLSALHLQDLALACACAEGRPDAWDHFVAAFRGYMRSAASAILRCPPDSPAACELADSLFADLYGLGEGANRRSLFRYFHGRSSLKTWLRAVLAQ